MPHIFRRIIRNCFALATVFTFIFLTPTANAASSIIGGGGGEVVTPSCAAGYYGSGAYLVNVGQDCTACPSDSSYSRPVSSEKGSNSKITDCYATCLSYSKPSNATSISGGYFAYYSGSSYPKCSYTVNCSAGYRVTATFSAPYKSCSACGTGYYCAGGTSTARTACTSYRANTTTTTTTASSTSQCVCAAGYYLNGSSCSACSSVRNTTSKQSCSDTTTNISNGTRKGTNGSQTCSGYYTSGSAGNNSATSQCTGCSSYGACSYTYTCTCNSGYHVTGSGASCSCAANTYTVKYNLNGGSGTTPSSTSCTYGTGCTLNSGSATTFYRAGYKITGWRTGTTSGTTYALGASVTGLTTTNGGTVTLYAVWTACGTGTYHAGSTGTAANTCPACSGATQYQDTTGQTSCKTVSSGWYKSSNSAQAQCPAGYQNGAGAASQANCTMTVTAGHYVATANSTTQSECTGATYKGSHSVTYGSTSSCSSCPTGYTANTDNAKTSQFQCQIRCSAGTRVINPSGTCVVQDYNISGGDTGNWLTNSHLVYYGMLSSVTYCPMGYDLDKSSTASSSHILTYANNTPFWLCAAPSVAAGYSVESIDNGMSARYIRLLRVGPTTPVPITSIQAFDTNYLNPGIIISQMSASSVASRSRLNGKSAATYGSGDVSSPTYATGNTNIQNTFTLFNGADGSGLVWDMGKIYPLWLIRIAFVNNIPISTSTVFLISVSSDGNTWTDVWKWSWATGSNDSPASAERPYINILLPALESAKKPCAAGKYYRNATDVRYLNGRSCSSCGTGEYSTGGASSCSSCANSIPTNSGYTSANTSGTCGWLCNAGYHRDGTNAACTICEAGTYKTSAGNATSCTACGVGTYNENEGSTQSTACLACSNALQYQDKTGQSQCKNVENGFYKYSNSAQVQCPDGYRDIAASSQNECIGTFTKSGGMVEPALPAGCASQTTAACTIPTCEYTKKHSGATVTDCTPGNCTKTITSVTALPGYRVNGNYCSVCGFDTYSTGGTQTQCTACPNGWRSPLGAADAGDCGRILNYQPDGTAASTKIYLRSGEQKTHPSLAAMIDGHVFYANMTRVESTIPGKMYIGYGDNTYLVYHDTQAAGTFQITTMPNTSSFSFNMSAAGTFYVDWGDGDVETITKTDTTNTTYSHTYATPGEYAIGLSGRATGYSTSSTAAAISFKNNTNLASIGGSLGSIFPTINNGGNGNQPRFYSTFANCTNMGGTIPDNLFDGVHGQMVTWMFFELFYNCPKLSGEIPGTLFSGITGSGADNAFDSVFEGCTGLTRIGSGLLSGISGVVASNLFWDMFANCTGLRGNAVTFGNITGGGGGSFYDMFENCTGLDGYSARNSDGTFLYNLSYISGVNSNTYKGCTNLKDYADIPSGWK